MSLRGRPERKLREGEVEAEGCPKQSPRSVGEIVLAGDCFAAKTKSAARNDIVNVLVK